MHRLSDFVGLGGIEVVRDGTFGVTGKISTPLNELCVPLRSAEYAEQVNCDLRFAAVITRREIVDALDERLAIAVAPDPDAAHSEVHAVLAELHAIALRQRVNVIDRSARIDPSARIADHAVAIGPDVTIGPNVYIAPGVTIEAGCVFHSGVALGVLGFNVGIIGGRQRIVPQMGGLRIGQNVEMLANCTVARAIFGGDTTIGEETVTDNLVYIAHDAQIGRRVQICALANILGRAQIGEGAYIGPSAVVKNGIVLGERARVSIGAVVTRDVASGETVSGNFAVQHERFLEHMRSIR